MGVIKILKSYRGLYLDAQKYLEVYNTLNLDIGGGAINYDGMPRSMSISSRTESDAIRLADAYLEYRGKWLEAQQRMIDIENLISQVSSWRGRYILHERYVKFRTLEEIGDDDEINRCGRQVRRYHDEAIYELDHKQSHN